MEQKDRLAYEANYTYRKGYDDGFQDGVIQERSEGATREAYLQGIEEQKMKQWECRWHDLRKNPEDLPKNGVNLTSMQYINDYWEEGDIAKFEWYESDRKFLIVDTDGHYHSAVFTYCLIDGEISPNKDFWDVGGDCIIANAWKEIEPFQEEGDS